MAERPRKLKNKVSNLHTQIHCEAEQPKMIYELILKHFVRRNVAAESLD